MLRSSVSVCLHTVSFFSHYYRSSPTLTILHFTHADARCVCNHARFRSFLSLSHFRIYTRIRVHTPHLNCACPLCCTYSCYHTFCFITPPLSASGIRTSEKGVTVYALPPPLYTNPRQSSAVLPHSPSTLRVMSLLCCFSPSRVEHAQRWSKEAGAVPNRVLATPCTHAQQKGVRRMGVKIE
mmetsp:Transcript_43820/g.114289  ORF Transcript_43820/g.114289 Transcript_43820/m.114289 type:complete len:182 (-) Transcript_43820:627-1172(-)